MAISKCKEHGPPPGTKRRYIREVEPLEYPNRAILCNRSGCERSALIWLDEEEAALYVNGERTFRLITGAGKVKVK